MWERQPSLQQTPFSKAVWHFGEEEQVIHAMEMKLKVRWSSRVRCWEQAPALGWGQAGLGTGTSAHRQPCVTRTNKVSVNKALEKL